MWDLKRGIEYETERNEAEEEEEAWKVRKKEMCGSHF